MIPDQAAALMTLWHAAGSRTVAMPKGSDLWHSGLIAGAQSVDDAVALFATRDRGLSGLYRPQAGVAALRSGRVAATVRFATRIDLRLADFGRLSLRNFMERFGFSHDDAKRALRSWCLEEGLDGVVELNRGSDEVVICRPAQHLEVVTICPIAPSKNGIWTQEPV